MITNTTAKITYTFTEGITEYAVGFVYQTNPDGSPQIKVYINDAVNTPLVYGTDYTMSQDGTKVVIASGAEVGDSLTIIRNIPIVQLSDYVVGRIDPEQIENDFDLCVERDQQQSARITVTEEQLAAHDERISDIEEVVPESATTDNLLATVSDIPTDLAQLTNSPGYITGITSSDVTTALGYTPYDSSNPDGYTTNMGTVTSVNNVQPVNGNVTLEFPTAEQSDWAQSDNTKVDYIKNKPTIPTVNNATITITQGGVTKGSFSLNQTSGETIALDAGGSGGGVVDSVNGQTGVVVLTASDVGALPDDTVIPDAQVNSDWNANSGVAQILNKPTIPTVNDSTITITQGGVTKGTFTTNQSGNTTIVLDAGGGSIIPQSIDAEIVGSLTQNGSVFSGFSINDYLTLPWNPVDLRTPFEFVVGANLTAGTLNQQIAGLVGTVYGGGFILLYSGSTGELMFNGVYGNVIISGPISTNTDYLIKVSWDGTDYKMFASADNGATYTQIGSTVSNTGTCGYGVLGFGKSGGTQYYEDFLGTINLSGAYLKIGENIVWTGMDSPGLHQKANTDLSNIPANIDYVVESQLPTAQNNYTWYRKYKSGWVEQGGISQGSGSSTYKEVSLAIEMSSNNYTLILTPLNANAVALTSVYYANKTTVSFSFQCAYNGGGSSSTAYSAGEVSWQVSGMAQG